jgi:hypothetical protein
MLLIYRAACLDYLNEKKDIFNKLANIRDYEKAMVKMAWMRIAPDDESQLLQEQMLKLRQTQLAAHYGEYTIILKLQPKTWEELTESYPWEDIAERLRNESGLWDARSLAKSMRFANTSYSIWMCCKALDLDFAYMTFSICNQGVLKSVGKLFAESRYAQVAQVLWVDLKDLSSCMPVALQEDEDVLRATIVNLRNDWFTIQACPGEKVVLSLGISQEIAPPSAWLLKKEFIKSHSTVMSAAPDACTFPISTSTDTWPGSAAPLARPARADKICGQDKGE